MVRIPPLALSCALLVALLLPSASTQAGGSAPISGPITMTTSGQITLSLQLPGAAYPLNALVPVFLKITNGSTHDIETWDCVTTSLFAEVPQPNGVGQLYPPLLPPPGAPWSGCPGPAGMGMMRQPVSIPSGRTLNLGTYVVLRALTVRGVALLQTQPGQGKPVVLQTPPIHVAQTRAPAPKVHITVQGRGTALATPVRGGGPVFYSQYASCADAAHAAQPLLASATYSQWFPAAGTTLQPFTPACSKLREWVLFVGQLGYPITEGYYCAQDKQCAYNPPTTREQALVACKRDIARAVQSGELPRLAARYAIGLEVVPPAGLTAKQRTIAQQFHARCAPLLQPASGTP